MTKRHPLFTEKEAEETLLQFLDHDLSDESIDAAIDSLEKMVAGLMAIPKEHLEEIDHDLC